MRKYFTKIIEIVSLVSIVVKRMNAEEIVDVLIFVLGGIDFELFFIVQSIFVLTVELREIARNFVGDEELILISVLEND